MQGSSHILARIGSALAAVTATTAVAAPSLSYEKDIRPILKANCFQCHGEEGETKGGLDVRLKKFLLKGGESGPAIVPGKPHDSKLLELVSNGEMALYPRRTCPSRAWGCVACV